MRSLSLIRPFLTVCLGFPHPLKVRRPLPSGGATEGEGSLCLSVTHCSGRSQEPVPGQRSPSCAGPGLVRRGRVASAAAQACPSQTCRERGQASSWGSPAQEMTPPVRLVLEPSRTGARLPDASTHPRASTPSSRKGRASGDQLKNSAGSQTNVYATAILE